jgi:hypothetical protein
MTAPDFTSSRWRTSSRSNGAQLCIEVAWDHTTTITGVRDSKHPTSPTLTINQTAWETFLTHWKTAASPAP